MIEKLIEEYERIDKQLIEECEKYNTDINTANYLAGVKEGIELSMKIVDIAETKKYFDKMVVLYCKNLN